MTPDALPADHDDGEDEAPLRALLEDQRLSRFAIRGDPPEHLTDWQRSVIASPYKHTVAWGANGIGKSLVIAEITRRALAGQLHWQRGAGPRTVMLVGNTWQQLGSTLAYLWRFVDKRWFRAGLRFEGGRVMGQRLAVFDIIAGPGRGGELRCGTFRAENLAGPRAEVVITDEPLPEDVYNASAVRASSFVAPTVTSLTLSTATAEINSQAVVPIRIRSTCPT